MKTWLKFRIRIRFPSSSVSTNTNMDRASAGSSECSYRAYLVQCFSLAGLTMALICLLQREESRYHTDELHCQCASVHECMCSYCVSFLCACTSVYVSLCCASICHSVYCAGVCLSPFTFSTYLDMQTPLCEGVRCEKWRLTEWRFELQ